MPQTNQPTLFQNGSLTATAKRSLGLVCVHSWTPPEKSSFACNQTIRLTADMALSTGLRQVDLFLSLTKARRLVIGV